MLPSAPSLLRHAAFAVVLGCASAASAATTLMVNFSSVAGNDITSGQATTLGLDLYQNVRTNVTLAAGTTTSISLDGITGSVTYADFFQQNQLTALGQPYATLLGGAQIGSTGNEAVVSLSGINAWMTANNFTSYQVVVYYAGRSAASENLASTSQAVSFVTTSSTTYDTITGGCARHGVKYRLLVRHRCHPGVHQRHSRHQRQVSGPAERHRRRQDRGSPGAFRHPVGWARHSGASAPPPLIRRFIEA
ncbi:MAG: hypothetical protein QM755_10375 [Luteolibacter sp.]